MAEIANRQVAAHFFGAARALAVHTGSLQERLADAYADHLLSISLQDLPADLQPILAELEAQLNRSLPEGDEEDPFQAAAAALSDAEATAAIERILLLYGRLAGAAASQ